MRPVSQYVVMFFWSAVCVRPQDPSSLKSSSDANTASPQCFIQIGDVPFLKCDSSVDDTTPLSSSAVTESDPTTVFTTVTDPTSTTVDSNTAAPATITPRVHPSPHSPDETKFTAETPTQKPVIVAETAHKNHEARRNAPESTNCLSFWMGLDTEVYLLVVCGVQMVIMATLSVCLYKQCKKQPAENLHLTRLISVPNPAFSNP